MSGLTQKDTIEALYGLEHRLRLFEQEVAGIRYWKLVRFAFFRLVLKKLGMGEERVRTDRRPSFAQELRSWSRSIDLRRPRGDVVIYEFFRKTAVGGRMVDPYTAVLDRVLREQGSRPVLIESDQLGHMGGFSPRRYAMKRAYWVRNRPAARWFARFRKALPSDVLREVERELAGWGVDVDLRPLVLHKTDLFCRSYFEDLARLRRIAPREVFLLPSYNSEGRIEAARSLGIPVTELQHGTINPYHFGYHFDAGQTIPYLPDRLLCFSPQWLDGVSYGNVAIVPAGDYTPFHRRTSAGAEKTIDLLVISQWILSRRLWEFTVEFARNRPEVSIVYKAHPRDSFETLGAPPNLRVERKESLYDLMARSRQALGVYSTGVYEALLFGCRPVLLDLPGIEMMESFVRVTGVRTVSTPAELSAALAEPTAGQRLDPDLWYPPERLGAALKEFP